MRYRFIAELNETFEAPEGLSETELEDLAKKHIREAIEEYGICCCPDPPRQVDRVCPMSILL